MEKCGEEARNKSVQEEMCCVLHIYLGSIVLQLAQGGSRLQNSLLAEGWE